MTAPRAIGPGEDLGRGVFSSRNRDRARRGKTPHHVFLEREGTIEVSVDRLNFAPETEMSGIADRVAANRNATFYGWAVVVEDRARANGRGAIASPITDNPYHADIILPAPAAEDREEQKRHAQELADASTWRGRPERGDA